MSAEGTRTGIDVLEFASQSGADLKLRKPFNQAQLFDAITQIM